MTRSRLFGCLLGFSGMLLPARLAFGSDPVPVPGMDAFAGVWHADVTPDQGALNDGRNAFKDNILFENDGHFTAEAFGPMGYGRSDFTVTEVESGVYAFTTTMSSDTQGTLVWNGVRQGTQIVGSLVWSKPDGSVGTYNFTAAPLD